MEKVKYCDLKTLITLIDDKPTKCIPAEVYESFSEEQKQIAKDFMCAVTFLSINHACTDIEAIKIFSKMPLEDETKDKVKMLF